MRIRQRITNKDCKVEIHTGDWLYWSYIGGDLSQKERYLYRSCSSGGAPAAVSDAARWAMGDGSEWRYDSKYRILVLGHGEYQLDTRFVRDAVAVQGGIRELGLLMSTPGNFQK